MQDVNYVVDNINKNPQDVALLLLLFYGVKGKAFKEIRGLLDSDCNYFNNVITLQRNKEKVMFKLPSSVMNILKLATEQNDVYYKRNGYYDSESRRNSTWPIFQSNYVIKQVMAGNAKTPQATPQAIRNRISKLLDVYREISGSKIKASCTEDVFQSGTIYYMLLFEKYLGGSLEPIDYKRICQRCGDKPSNYSVYKIRYTMYKKHYPEALSEIELTPELRLLCREISSIKVDCEISENKKRPKLVKKAPYIEGREKIRYHKTKERKPQLMREAKRLFKEKNERIYCEGCGFDFYKTYGILGEDYIEGHHIKEINSLTEETEMVPEDIAMVCSNCHSMIHRSNPSLTIEQLKHILMEPSKSKKYKLKFKKYIWNWF
ncbi:HNH endonuclease [Alkaliphilus hydrothermalis]|uniref:HNH domain-containing protein n=1 Tax=Alkaliphilus hydrothermalis TaxID=1482730 RepID=A0ABS2NTP2_9FIRM|nr:HNH endonuclease [Alkaliphilus hydrothermalis]MBM7616315.1 hypothetical protein [Alkaliphilus hydrothermalis]